MHTPLPQWVNHGILGPSTEVRFSPPSLRSRCAAATGALCQWPTLARLFDSLVGEREQRRRHVETECFGGVEIDHELELYRRLCRKIGRLFSFEDAIDRRKQSGGKCPRYPARMILARLSMTAAR